MAHAECATAPTPGRRGRRICVGDAAVAGLRATLPRRTLPAADQRQDPHHGREAHRGVQGAHRQREVRRGGRRRQRRRRLHRHHRSPRPHRHPRDDRQPLPRPAGGEPAGLRDPRHRDGVLDRGSLARHSRAGEGRARGGVHHRHRRAAAAAVRGEPVADAGGAGRRGAAPPGLHPHHVQRPGGHEHAGQEVFREPGREGVRQRPDRDQRAVVGRAGRAAIDLDAGRHQADHAAGVRLLQQRRADHRALGAGLAGPRAGAVLRLGRAPPDAGVEEGGPAHAAAAALLQHRPARGRQAWQPRAVRRARQPVGGPGRRPGEDGRHRRAHRRLAARGRGAARRGVLPVGAAGGRSAAGS